MQVPVLFSISEKWDRSGSDSEFSTEATSGGIGGQETGARPKAEADSVASPRASATRLPLFKVTMF
jgi:hypothetical protein